LNPLAIQFNECRPNGGLFESVDGELALGRISAQGSARSLRTAALLRTFPSVGEYGFHKGHRTAKSVEFILLDGPESDDGDSGFGV
jgi:hypothetical protein